MYQKAIYVILSVCIVLSMAACGAQTVMPAPEQPKTEEKTMPNLVGKSFDEVKTMEEFKDVTFVEWYAYSSDYPAGTIVAQLREPGNVVKKGEELVVIVNREQSERPIGTPDSNLVNVGNIEIKLYESQNEYDAAALQIDKSALVADDAVYQTEYLDKHAPIVPAEEVAKNTYIENTGKNPAYVRFVVTVPKEMNPFVTLKWNDNGEFTLSGPADNADGDKEYVFTRNATLGTGEFTDVGLKSFELKATMTEADIAKLVAEGFMNNDNRTFNILVRAEAIQSNGFYNVTEAFAAFHKYR
ncbi:MAG: PASTA domain-containing protein [Clostridia bacterium]|nr:PASTA domain-containing protein [Clostridia bacterium]